MTADERINHLCTLMIRALAQQRQMIQANQADLLRLANRTMELSQAFKLALTCEALDSPDWRTH